MIIQSLCKYYEILANDEKCDIARPGYSNAKISAALIISVEGKLVDIISLMTESENGKNFLFRNMIVPIQSKRSGSSAPSNYMCDNVQYVLGFDKDKNLKEKQFNEFRDKHNKILGSATGRCAKAILNFINTWKVDYALNNPIIINNFKLLVTGNLVFRLDGEREFLHMNNEIKQLWEQSNSIVENPVIGQCLITGKRLVIERIHNSIKPLYMQKGKQPSPNGWTLVAVDKDSTAFDSYNKKQSFNSPISKNSAFAYTTVLNYMLSSPKQKVQIGDATAVFWAEREGIYVDLAAELLNPSIIQEGEENKSIYKRDSKIEALVKDILLKAKTGMMINDFNEEIDPQVRFYVLGLSPNASRVSVRFFHSDSFGGFINKTVQHYKDMGIIKDFDNQPDNIPIWRILSETVSPKSNNKEANPLLAGSMMRAILNGGLYPTVLFNEIMTRVKTDSEIRVNYIRASIIKACLLRKARITKTRNMEEVLTLSLNEQSTEKSYLLGRLFAILEKTQKDSGNETIRARYFASAMATPGAVFPILLRLAQHHIVKEEYGFINDKNIEMILNKIEYDKDIKCFPSYLTLDEQGVFALGYYHQRTKLWEKQVKENTNLKEEK